MAPDPLAQWLEAARWAIECWAAFPVDREPRPLVVWQPPTATAGSLGAAKQAFLHGLVEARAPVPEVAASAWWPEPPIERHRRHGTRI